MSRILAGVAGLVALAAGFGIPGALQLDAQAEARQAGTSGSASTSTTHHSGARQIATATPLPTATAPRTTTTRAAAARPSAGQTWSAESHRDGEACRRAQSGVVAAGGEQLVVCSDTAHGWRWVQTGA